MMRPDDVDGNAVRFVGIAGPMDFASGARAGFLKLQQKLSRIGQGPFVRDGAIRHLPGLLGGWTAVRDLSPVPKQSFREWWASRSQGKRS